MARTKASRRDRGRRWFLSILATAVVLAVVSSRFNWPLRQTLLTPVHFLLGGGRLAVDAAGGALGRVAALWRSAGENAALRLKVQALEMELVRAKALILTAGRKLEGLTASSGAEDFHRVVADVIAGEASPWRESIVLAAGASSGVRKDMPVVWSGAAVGRVIAVGPATCRVLLLTDPAFRAGIRCARTGVRGVLAGAGAGRARLDFVAHDADVRVNDEIVTSGADGIFPPNFFVGKCTRSSPQSGELTLQVDLRPAVRGRGVESVEVLLWAPPEAPPPLPVSIDAKTR